MSQLDKTQYRRVMRRIEELMRKLGPTHSEEDLLELLAALAACHA